MPSTTGPLDAALAENGPVVASIRQAFPNALGIYAFGSRIKGTANPDSDLDLAVLVAGYADPLALWRVANQLIDLVNCPVDLLDLRAASTVMQSQVLTEGRRLWGKDPEAGIYECFVMSEKNNLDTARAALLRDIAQEGSVYGR